MVGGAGAAGRDSGCELHAGLRLRPMRPADPGFRPGSVTRGRSRSSWERGRPPGIAGVPPASGPQAHRCSSGRDARAPRVRLEPWRRLQGPSPRPLALPVRREGSESTGAAVSGSAGVPPASGPQAHRCSSGRDARAPRVRLEPWRRLQGPSPRPLALPVRREGSESTGAAVPGSAGVPPASGPQAHSCPSGRDARDPRDTSMRRVGSGVTSDDAAPIPRPVEGRGQASRRATTALRCRPECQSAESSRSIAYRAASRTDATGSSMASCASGRLARGSPM